MHTIRTEWRRRGEQATNPYTHQPHDDDDDNEVVVSLNARIIRTASHIGLLCGRNLRRHAEMFASHALLYQKHHPQSAHRAQHRFNVANIAPRDACSSMDGFAHNLCKHNAVAKFDKMCVREKRV